MSELLAGFSFLALAALLYFCPAQSPSERYRYSEVNPYRRYCLRCGQQQDSICWAGDEANYRRAWWEAHGAVGDPNCACHKDVDRAA